MVSYHTLSRQGTHAIPFLKRFTVFNADQCDGLPDDITVAAPPGLIEPRVEALIRATGIDFRIGGNCAFYMPSLDYVQVPPLQAISSGSTGTARPLHELGHASGHHSRLNRDLNGSFGSKKYACEEMIAEQAADWLPSHLPAEDTEEPDASVTDRRAAA
ncbi:MAG TPA: zincin-like metallopeptidase domain-containing protein [Rhizobium sp.]